MGKSNTLNRNGNTQRAFVEEHKVSMSNFYKAVTFLILDFTPYFWLLPAYSFSN